MQVSEFRAMRRQRDQRPLIEPPFLSPVIADPSFLFPYETPDSQWHLFAHSAWGLCEYTSPDGRAWTYRGIRVANAMRPFVRRLRDGPYVLLYEKYAMLAMPLQILPGYRKWKSHIELRRSDDLKSWDDPVTVIGPERDWMADAALGESVSNPCLLEVAGSYRLYFSASLSYVEDCGFNEPRYIALATSANLTGPYVIPDEPIIDPDDDDRPGVIGAGSMKVIALEDGYVALQNMIYADPDGRSRSALFLLTSPDGIDWRAAASDPIIAPGSGWTRSHVYACDCRRDDRDGSWHLYFNARDGWKMTQGRERIGRAVSE